MRIDILEQRKKGAKTIELEKGMVLVQINPEEAVLLIKSLSTQLITHGINVEGPESYNAEGTYFSIAVSKR